MIDVAIVGAGLSGLACARTLTQRGLEVAVFESAGAVGGRIRTHRQEGFLIDRGFQVLLTAYPEARAVLDYDALGLGAFEPAALVRHGGAFHPIGDPFRQPLQAVPTLLADVGTIADKLRVLRLRQSVRAGTDEALWARPEMTTLAALRDRYGFSERMIDRFFRPFLGGVLLDPELSASSRAFEVYFRRFSEGVAALPADGMQAIPEQIAAGLPDGTVRLGARVERVEPREVHVSEGDAVACRAVVVAADGPHAGALLHTETPPSKGTTQLAYAAQDAPIDRALLVLDGDGAGPVNNAQVVSLAQPSYAPARQALVTASVVGRPPMDDDTLDAAARAQLRGWFGDAVDGWRTLRIDHVPDALPALPSLDPPERPVRVGHLYVAGDWRRNGSINGALVSGRHAAEAVLADLAV
ncbi:NAD(P)/FAD-dependent oxidoreductase [Rubrivirga sp. IMCC43871]|uniref:NAD(P)/FAD-dependent oxidoreductase n=1 Tax=Rubrivirga sp. IMCC43871 TaxID=3391575 RepID=UPI00398FBF4B